MFKYDDNKEKTHIKLVCLGRMHGLWNANHTDIQRPLISSNSNEKDSWSEIDMAFILADANEVDTVEKLKILISLAQSNNVFVIPIVVSDKDIDLKAATIYINPVNHKNDDEIIRLTAFIIKSLKDIVCVTGIVDLDISSIKSIIDNKGKLFLGCGEGRGDGANIKAAKKSLDHLSSTCNGEQVKGILLNITGSENLLSMMDMLEITEIVNDWVINNECTILWGATIDNDLKDEIRVFIMAQSI